jgi:hypothetical protein
MVMLKPFKSEGFIPIDEVGWGVTVAVGGIWVVVVVRLGVNSGVSITSVRVGVGSLLQAANRIMERESISRQVEYKRAPLINEIM